MIDGIMMEDKKEVDKVILTGAELSKYFGKGNYAEEMRTRSSSCWTTGRVNRRNMKKPEKKNEQEK